MFCCTRTVICPCIMPGILGVSRTRSHECSERLEPDIGELIRPVLRGGGGGNAVSLLDTLRLTVMGQMIRGLAGEQDGSNLIASPPSENELTSERVSTAGLEETLASMKWHVWHGNVERALERADELVDDLETWPPASDKVAKLKKA